MNATFERFFDVAADQLQIDRSTLQTAYYKNIKEIVVRKPVPKKSPKRCKAPNCENLCLTARDRLCPWHQNPPCSFQGCQERRHSKQAKYCLFHKGGHPNYDQDLASFSKEIEDLLAPHDLVIVPGHFGPIPTEHERMLIRAAGNGQVGPIAAFFKNAEFGEGTPSFRLLKRLYLASTGKAKEFLRDEFFEDYIRRSTCDVIYDDLQSHNDGWFWNELGWSAGRCCLYYKDKLVFAEHDDCF